LRARLLVVVAAVCLLLSVAVTAAPVEIEYWGMWAGRHLGYETAVIDKFNEEYEGRYRVVGIEMDVHEQLPVAVAAGVGPGVVKIDRFRTASYAHAGLIQSLQPFVERDGVDLSAFYPATISEATFDGHVYALPWDTDTRALYYNKDMFAEHGLDPDSPPRTWDDVTELNRTFERFGSDGNLTQAGLLEDRGNWGGIGWLFSAGVELLDESGRQVLWNTTQAEQALEFMQGSRRRYGSQAVNALWDGPGFPNRGVAMALQVSGYAGNLETNAPDLNYGLAFPPRPEGLEDEPVSWSGGFAFSMPVGLSEEEKEAAWAFIKFWGSHWAQMQMAVNARYLPSLASAGRDPELWDRFPEIMFFSQVLPYSKWRPVSPFGDAVWGYISEISNSIIQGNGDTPVRSVLEDTARRAQAFLDEAWGRVE